MQNDIHDRPPLSSWGRGRITLLGDAAHAMTPNMGQGACQALEDAVALANCLCRIRSVEAALRQYERLRIPRTAAIVRKSRKAGQILQLDQPGSCACQVLQYRFGSAIFVSGDGVQGKGPAFEVPCPAQRCSDRQRSRCLPELSPRLFIHFPQWFHIQITDRFDPVLMHFDGQGPYQP